MKENYENASNLKIVYGDKNLKEIMDSLIEKIFIKELEKVSKN